MEVDHENVVITDVSKLVADPNPSGIWREDPMAVPHNLFTIRPTGKDVEGIGRMTAKTEIATLYIRKLISYEVATAGASERIKIFQTLSIKPMLRSAAGTLFEIFVLCWFASGSGSLHCTSAYGSTGLEIPACAGKDQTLF
jgi:hypothetical protein